MNRELTVSYIENLYVGMTGEVSRIENREVPLPNERPPILYGFRIFDRTEYTTESGELLVGERRNICRIVFGEEITLAQVKERKPEWGAHLDSSDWKRWALLDNDHLFGLEENDKVISR